MKKKDIINNINARLGIDNLNEMQRTMADTDCREMVLIAPTGSGKTLAFAIRMLRNVDQPSADANRGVSAVVIAPTRELVIQLAEVIRPIAVGLKTVAFYGGHSMADEVNSLAGALPDIVISTPGRLVDHLKRATIDITGAKSLVLDEYDKSLQLGFYDEMRRIVHRVRRPSLCVLTSATRFTGIEEFPSNNDSADSRRNTPSRKSKSNQMAEEKPLFDLDKFRVFDFGGAVVEPEPNTAIIQVLSPIKDKLDTLVDMLRSLDNGKVIVFVNHRESAVRVYDRLKAEYLPAGLYHGGLEQQQRRLAVDLLAHGSTPILVTTDLASRGLDIPEVSAVVHYHLPLQHETWTHRNGRTARQGAQGSVYVITSPGETLPEGESADAVVEALQPSQTPIVSDTATLYFNAGKKEKISKGDIAGFLIQKGGLDKTEVGLIVVDDHWAIAAVPRAKLTALLAQISQEKVKGKRLKITPLHHP